MTVDIIFRLAAPLQLPNRKSNLDWKAKGAMTKKARELLAWEIRAVLAGQLPLEPFEYSSVIVFRHGITEPDRDNLYASAKDLLDVLQPMRDKRPKRLFGLGIISDDKPSRCAFDIKHVKAKSSLEQYTLVRIRDLTQIQKDMAA
jgi:hypothetical protein